MFRNHTDNVFKLNLQFFSDEIHDEDMGDTAIQDAFEAFGIEPPKAEEPTEEIMTEEEPEEPSEAPTTEPTQDEPKGIKVKYNKEEVFIPETDLPTLAQKGMNYDKVQQRLNEIEQQNAYLDRLAKMSGYADRNAFITAVEEADRTQRYQQQAQQLSNQFGMEVDPRVLQNAVDPLNQKLQSLETELNQVRQQDMVRNIQSDIARLEQQYPDFNQHWDKVYDLALNNGYPLEVAYKLATYDTKPQEVAKQAEQKVIKQQQLGLRAKVEKSAEPAKDVHMSEAQKEAFAAFGIDPKVGKQFIKSRR